MRVLKRSVALASQVGQECVFTHLPLRRRPLALPLYMQISSDIISSRTDQRPQAKKIIKERNKPARFFGSRSFRMSRLIINELLMFLLAPELVLASNILAFWC